jgi:hypothetical protein
MPTSPRFAIDDLATYLRSIAAITDLVGTRIRPNKLMQGDALPAIRYAFPGGGSLQHLGGISGTASPTLQIDCYGATATAAWALAEIVRLTLQPFVGQMGNTYVEGFSLTNRLSEYEEPVDAGDVGKHRVILTFDVAHDEATE